eukprot:Phypoly_transcript_03003.p1 GENE.Phypoly_transcript_03003~~Phypoly_transcript_03003.p1  ORF type:complete len:794 (-),score=172.71 Phypoly_transcript_03003:221-2440(-)
MEAPKPAARSSTQPVKKLVIKNLKEAPKLPANFEEETWGHLKKAIHAIHKKERTPHSLEELYRMVENLCYHKMAANLYAKLYQEVELHIKEELKKLFVQTSDNSVFLTLVDNCWQAHCSDMIMIRSIFLYLDRTYVIQTSGTRSLWDMGLQLFRTHIAVHPDIERKTVHGILTLIEKDRNGDTVDRTQLKSLLRMFSALGIYVERFEKAFLDATQEFYAKESEHFLATSEVAEYLKHVETRLADESDRVHHYLEPTTKKPLIATVETQLIEKHVATIIAKGFDSLMINIRHDDLRRMYSLFARVGALDQLKIALNKHIKTVGQALVTDTEKDETMVQELLDFKARLDVMLEQAFSKNEQFTYTLKEAFEFFVNVRANKPAELIAKFIDARLRSGNKGTTEEETEHLLDKVMTLFRYIQGKDVFEAFYKKDLAKRLLLDKSSSTDLEKSMISKLKAECGSSFTNKLEGMFKDMDLSKDIMAAFYESKEATNFQATHNDIELNVYVLTAVYWPAYQPVEVNLPKEVAEYQEVFKKFYLAKHSGRRLTWQNSLGFCVVRAFFPIARKELSVSLFQAVVLALFNDVPDGGQLTLKEIQEGSGIEEKELKLTLHSLACQRIKILNKSSKSRDVENTDSFSFNKEFTSKLFRIKANAIQLKETVEEQQKTTEGVFQDRQYQIDAAIVRIMKTRKTLSHTMLVTEVYQQLKFPIKPPDLKKRIESLIEREYMERDSTNSNQYNYLA